MRESRQQRSAAKNKFKKTKTSSDEFINFLSSGPENGPNFLVSHPALVARKRGTKGNTQNPYQHRLKFSTGHSVLESPQPLSSYPSPLLPWAQAHGAGREQKDRNWSQRMTVRGEQDSRKSDPSYPSRILQA